MVAWSSVRGMYIRRMRISAAMLMGMATTVALGVAAWTQLAGQ